MKYFLEKNTLEVFVDIHTYLFPLNIDNFANFTNSNKSLYTGILESMYNLRKCKNKKKSISFYQNTPLALCRGACLNEKEKKKTISGNTRVKYVLLGSIDHRRKENT